MARKRAIYLAICAAAIGYCLAFGFPAVYPVRVLWYYPTEHRWTYELKAAGVAIDWYGRDLLAAITALVCAAGGYQLGLRSRLSANALRTWAGWVASSALMIAALYAYQLAMRRPTPALLPTDHQPR